MAKNVSNQFKNIIKNGGPFYAHAVITLADGTIVTMTSDMDFSMEGNEYSEGGDSGFPLGAALSKTITIRLDNTVTEDPLQDSDSLNILDSQGRPILATRKSLYNDYYYARIVLYTEADLPDGTTERIQEGIFTVVDSVKPSDTLEIVAYDDMYKADVNFVSTLSYPISAQMLLNEVCNKCGITLGSATFPNNSFQIQQAPEGLTGRQVIGYIAQIAGGNAIIDSTGHLKIVSYDLTPFDTQEEVTAGEIETESGIHIISEYINDPDIGTDNVTITGVSVTIPAEDADSEDEEYVVGTEEYAIKIDNPLIAGNEKTAVDFIAQSVIGITMRPFSGEFFPDPTIEFMDLAYVVDTKNQIYKTFITSLGFSYFGKSTLSNDAESPERYGGSYYSAASQVYQKAKNEIKNNKKQWEQAIEDLTDRVNNASGLYTTADPQEDGSVIYYMHNKPTLEESAIVWELTAESITVSTDGGHSWNGGFTVDGEMIASIMSTIGLNFDWGIGGTLLIEDPDGNETAYMDAETGTIRFSVQSLKIAGKTIDEIYNEKIEDYDDSLTQQEIFNRLTNNGTAQGIYMQGNQLYLNGQYMEFNGATIGGWLINDNQLINDQTGFTVRIQAPSTYGTVGLGTSDIIAVHDTSKDTWPFVVTSDGSVDIGTDFYYRPNGFSYDSTVQLNVGGWQIKRNQNVWDYDEVIYWDTVETQTNGIGAKGPWVIWGGWNGGESINVDNYKFVVTDQGVCKAMSWVTGSRLEWKENIVPYNKSAVQEIMNSDVYYYDLKNQSKSAWQEGRHIGFIIGDGYNVSTDILDGGGGAIDMYSALAIAYKAIQELQTEIQTIKQKIKA